MATEYTRAYESPAHLAAADERHAACRDAATKLTAHAATTVVARGFEPTSTDVVVAFGADAVAPVLIDDVAPCGCYEDVLAAAVMTVAELSIRLAVAQAKLDELGVDKEDKER